VDTNGMHVGSLVGHLQHAMQQTTAFRAADRNIAIFVMDDRELGHHGIAMVSFGIHGVAPVSELRPNAVGKEFVMRRVRVVVEFVGVRGVRAGNFLHENHVCPDLPHCITQLMEDELTVKKGEPLVDVHRHDFD